MRSASRSLAGVVPMNYGSFLPTFWVPYRYQRFGPTKWNAAFAGAETAESPASIVVGIISAFKRQGHGTGMAMASHAGIHYRSGAQRYVQLAGATEEELAAEAAKLTTEVARGRLPPNSAPAILKAFVDARLAEVRSARKNGATPPQAVLDRATVATHGIPKWVTYAALGLSGLGILLAVASASKRHGRH